MTVCVDVIFGKGTAFFLLKSHFGAKKCFISKNLANFALSND